MLRDAGLLTRADFAQCTNCGRARLAHPAEQGQGIGHVFVKTGCAQFESKPFVLMNAAGSLTRFASSQELKEATRK
jgi:hypothetical protein